MKTIPIEVITMSDKTNKDQLSDDELKNVSGGAKSQPGDGQTGAVDDIQSRRLQGLDQRDSSK